MKTNYLNNKDILKEIHKSKTSYCTFVSASDADYDSIVLSLSDITEENITLAVQNRIERLTKKDLVVAIAGLTPGQDKPKLVEFLSAHADVSALDVVFRVMTWDHIPKGTILKKQAVDDDEPYDTTSLDNMKYVKVNFPPFQHWKVGTDGVAVCVGKSHWRGPLDTGEFDRTHGTMTKTLATMFMKLCERYSTRPNWRGYTYNDEMRSQALLQLSQVGLQFDEGRSNNPFAYYTAIMEHSFTRVFNIEKRCQTVRDDILEQHNMNPSYSRQFSNNTGGAPHHE